jgi:amino acid transporter
MMICASLDGFKGFCSVFTTAAFAFSGTELVGLAAAETENPRKTLPTATKQVFWRVVSAFFLLSFHLYIAATELNSFRASWHP